MDSEDLKNGFGMINFANSKKSERPVSFSPNSNPVTVFIELPKLENLTTALLFLPIIWSLSVSFVMI